MSVEMRGAVSLAPTGSVGNITGTAVNLPANCESFAAQFVVEAIGATPTVTFKFQGSMDGTNWFDLPYVLPSTDTLSQATIAVTTVGASLLWLDDSTNRFFAQVRVVTTANTNVTFRAELYALAGA